MTTDLEHEREFLALEVYRFRYGHDRERPIQELLEDCRREVGVVVDAQQRYAEQAEGIERGL